MKYLEQMGAEEKRELIRQVGASTEQLPNILLTLQRRAMASALDEGTACVVAEMLDIPLPRVLDLIGYYEMLREKPSARYVLELCDSNPCRLAHGQLLLDCLKEELDIGPGEVTADGLFTIRLINCIGACHVGPVLRLGDRVYERMNAEKVHALLCALREGKGAEQ